MSKPNLRGAPSTEAIQNLIVAGRTVEKMAPEFPLKKYADEAEVELHRLRIHIAALNHLLDQHQVADQKLNAAFEEWRVDF